MDVYGLFGFGKVYFCLVYSFLLVRSGCVRIFRVGLCLFPRTPPLLACLLSSLACLLAGLLTSRLAAGCPPASLPPCLPCSLACLLAGCPCLSGCLVAGCPPFLPCWLACLLASCRSTFEDRFLKKNEGIWKKNHENSIAHFKCHGTDMKSSSATSPQAGM